MTRTPSPSVPTAVEPTRVLVVGGGPAGLAAAIELGRRGIDCLLVEPRAAVSHRRPRGKTTHARTMEHFRRWGIADELRATTPTPSEVFHDVAFCSTLLGHEVHRLPNALGLFAERRPEMSETGLFVGQPHVEDLLRRTVAGLAPIRTWYGARTTGAYAETPSAVDVEVADTDGTLRSVRASYVVVADGPRSTLRQALGVPLIAGAEGRQSVSVLFRAPALWSQVRHSPAVFYWCVGGRAAGNLSPYDTGRGIWVASWQAPPEPTDPAAVVDRLVGEPVGAEILNVDEWQSQQATAERYRSGRFFLVGDAARQTPPWGGHGYNTCVLDAVDLAWKLAAVLDGWAAERLLDTYEAERRPVADYVIETSSRNMRVLSDDLVRAGVDDDGPEGAAVRAKLASDIDAAKRSEFYSLGLVLGYNYAHSPAVWGEHSGADSRQPEDGTSYVPSFDAGHRLPHAWLPDGRSLFDLLGPGFTLLVDEHDDDVEQIVRAAAERAVPLTVLTSARLPEPYARPRLVLVRPDQHIAWSGRSLDSPAATILGVATGHLVAGRPR
ncbi:FAD-dependent monooxygenase [Phytohabitans kaempferiae]|uniref:FAD-dependent monooxygenase n=1 Tax=Phytohabitans kaempferiae TaxID=1620943 RepID=A0ABV6MCB4_9ACTN